MQIIFDKNLDTEARMTIDNFNENRNTNRFIGYHTFKVEQGSDFPDIPSVETFETIEVVNKKGIVIPLVNQYSKVVSIAIDYNDADEFYNMSVTIE